MASPHERRIQSIMKNYITPFLKEHGFVKDRSRYYRRLDDLTWLVEIERSGFNDATEARFTIDCGVYVPGLISRYAPVEEPTRPDYSECALSARLGYLAEDHIDTWWTLSIVDDEPQLDMEIGKDIVERLTRYGLPFLQRFQAPADVLGFLLEPRDGGDKQVWPSDRLGALIYATILSLLLGNRTKSHVLWEEAVQAAAKGPLESTMPVIEKRIFGAKEQ